MNIKFFTNSVNKVYYGSTLINKIYRGLVLLYSATSTTTTSFDYVYKILNLTYITNIEYSIYGLDYDGVSGGDVIPSVLNNNSYIYENEKIYSWF